MEKTPISAPESSVSIHEIKKVDKSQFPDLKDLMRYRAIKSPEMGGIVYFHPKGDFLVRDDGSKKILRVNKPTVIKNTPLHQVSSFYENTQGANVKPLETNHETSSKRFAIDIPDLEINPGEEPDTESDFDPRKLTMVGEGIGKGPNHTFYKVRNFKGKVFAKRF
ncbi:MAG: hypothetical protein KC582_00025 [Candidatus Magasanikbacteria bacterium]|nr:hypothetical protein [Candidatus Magasanikbacteria bacterium]MCA9390635.1 hypothetical protein [Candidatus Magasanikbacteria bacterium]